MPHRQTPPQQAEEKPCRTSHLVLSGFSSYAAPGRPVDSSARAATAELAAAEYAGGSSHKPGGRTGQSTPRAATPKKATVTLKTPDGRTWVWAADLAGFGLAFRELDRAAELGHAELVAGPPDPDLPATVQRPDAEGPA